MRAGTAAISLPQPDAADRLVCAQVRAFLARACEEEGGDIGFDRFMEIALYTPGLGYYSAPRARFGADGDFVTAPEISPRFGACIARAIAPALRELGPASVLEAGAGSGVLARDVLATLKELDVPLQRYCILERSASARAQQARTLADASRCVQWLDGFPPPGFRGVVIANELLDALPAQRFRIGADVATELRVGCEGEHLHWLERPFADPQQAQALQQMLRDLPPLAPGYVSEVAPARSAWLRTLAGCLERGLVLLADYGYPRREYYHPQRHDGTLRCYRRHHAHDDPLLAPGIDDISVHVDFTAVAEAGLAAGLRCSGFTTQAHFLLENGLLQGLEDPDLPESERAQAAHAVRQLTLPMEMGEAVKFMALERGAKLPLRGFATADLRHRLG
jgi:SAM-dependent MidA family methyltransferase